jgi:F0F1-type ATP synthase assembly protein I
LADPQEQNLAEREDVQALGAAQGLGCGIVASLILFIGLGIFLDNRFDTIPILTLVGVAIGLVSAGYQLYELSLIGRKDKESGPLGKVIGKRVAERRSHRNTPGNRTREG